MFIHNCHLSGQLSIIFNQVTFGCFLDHDFRFRINGMGITSHVTLPWPAVHGTSLAGSWRMWPLTPLTPLESIQYRGTRLLKKTSGNPNGKSILTLFWMLVVDAFGCWVSVVVLDGFGMVFWYIFVMVFELLKVVQKNFIVFRQRYVCNSLFSCQIEVISTCEKACQWQLALALLVEVKSLQPDVISYSTAISACGGGHFKAFEVY